MMSRRSWVATAMAALGGSHFARPRSAEGADPSLPAAAVEERLDFAGGIEGWTVVAGQWAVEPMDGSPSGKKVLVQRATRNEFDVIVAPPGPYTDVDVSMRFKLIAGREDASGGIVFRFSDGKYYVVRANALETNFRLYAYDRGRRQLASAKVTAPALGQWHTVRIVAVGEQMRAWLDGRLYLEHRDARFTAGRVGLWTKADSVTAFDELTIRGVPAANG